MDSLPLSMNDRLAELASTMQHQRTGHAPGKVTVVLSDDMLVVTLQDALTPAEKALAQTTTGAVKVQEYHRQLFANSCDAFNNQIKQVTGRNVREAAAEVEAVTGKFMHAFTTGAMVQVFLLAKAGASGAGSEHQRSGPL
jgi:uncharacterized protein YbcI